MCHLEAKPYSFQHSLLFKYMLFWVKLFQDDLPPVKLEGVKPDPSAVIGNVPSLILLLRHNWVEDC